MKDPRLDDSLRDYIAAELKPTPWATHPGNRVDLGSKIPGFSETIQQPKESTMPLVKKRTTKDMIQKTAKQAAIVAVGQQGEEMLFQWAKNATGQYWPELLKTPAGEEILRLAAPVVLHYALETYGDAIPQSEKLLKLCEGATQGNIQRNITTLFALLAPLLAQVQTLPNLPDEE
jgi:hypothetical protein